MFTRGVEVIEVVIADSFLPEKRYIFDVLIKEFLGLEYCLIPSAEGRSEYTIKFGDKSLVFRDAFFRRFSEEEGYLNESNIPKAVAYIENQFVCEPNIPLIFGDETLEVFDHRIFCGIDIFASSFFMLTRWEEFVNPVRDQHNRFPAIASLAYKNNFLLRPVVNEYLEMLWRMLRYLGFSGARRKREFRVEVSHDVDWPFRYFFQPPSSVIKPMARKLIKEHNFSAALKEPFVYCASKIKPERFDPFYTFDKIMDLSDDAGHKSAFYFIAGHSAGKIDGDYDIFHPRIRRLMKHIHDRGHEIGLHGSYNSYNDRMQYGVELSRLKESCEQSGVIQDRWGSRQHYLRWESPITAQVLNDARIDYDATLGYADHVGFRCGTCHEFSVFDYVSREVLCYKERPLLIMDTTLFDTQYLGGSHEELGLLVERLRMIVKKYCGNFTVLWHNSTPFLGDSFSLYKALIR